MNTIFIPWNNGFGDQWATINLLLHRASAMQKTQRLSRLQNGQDLGRMQEEILASLDAPPWVNLVPEPGNTPLNGFNVWATPYFPTKTQWCWRSCPSYAVCQFDGQSNASGKNPSLADQEEIVAALKEWGLDIIHIGKHLSVADCVFAAVGAALFVGADSGMLHLCHSVGVPRFILQYSQPIVTTNRGKAYILCECAKDFKVNLKCWMEYRTFLGLHAPHNVAQRPT